MMSTMESSLQNPPVAGFVTLMVEKIFFYFGRDKRIACMIFEPFFRKKSTKCPHFYNLSLPSRPWVFLLLDIDLWTMVKVVFLLNQTAPQQSAMLIFLCIQYSSVVQITKAPFLKTAIVSHFVEKVNLLAKELAFQDFSGLHWHIKGKGKTIQIFIFLKT